MKKLLGLASVCALSLSLFGCQGEKGPAGEAGATGPAGATGATGPAWTGPEAAPDAGPWKFAVMCDTQWGADDGKNPNTVATDIISQLNQEFIDHGVKLVVAVGDLSDKGCASLPCAPMQTRAAFAQALYNAGIGFYPLRGNHDSQLLGATEFRRLFPQTRDGVNNATPADALALTFGTDTITFPAKTGATFTIGKNFDSPWELPGLDGLSYAFDFNNVRFVLLDQFTQTNNYPNSIAEQQAWIDRALSARPAGGHAFVFGHKHLISDNHTDGLFGANPAADPEGQDAFIKSLSNNLVHYFIGGHDHMHLDSVFTTTDGVSGSVHDLVLASDSYKFYTPLSPSNDATYDVPAFGHARQTRITEELYTLGYYVFTVDGPRVTVEYFAAPSGYTGPATPDFEYTLTTTPVLHGNFTKHGTFGYSLNGKEFLVAQGASYATVSDSFATATSSVPTTFKILAGTNGSAAKDAIGLGALVKAIDTGWTAKTSATASDLLTLWGLGDLGATSTDTYVIQLSYDPASATGTLTDGKFGVAAKDASGSWVSAVSLNTGGTASFVAGAYTAGAALGTYGVDTTKKVAWAVVNQPQGTFAVARVP
jgi:hypothetical protein